MSELANTRKTMRAARDRSGLPRIVLVGYTNAGKSTLLNALTDAGVLSEDKLFATLDPTTRRLTLPDGEEALLTDTVGFIRNLPHHLIHAFRSTLDEVTYADYILVVTDVTDPESEAHIAVTESLLSELGVKDRPVLYVYNKCDRMPEFPQSGLIRAENKIYISAEMKYGLDLLLSELSRLIRAGKETVTLKIPYSDLSVLTALHNLGSVQKEDYLEDGVEVSVTLDRRYLAKYAEYRRL